MLLKLTCVALALLGFFTCEAAILEIPSCQGAEDGRLFADSSSCSHYYICLKEKAELLMCPKSLKFNPETSICDTAENLPRTAPCLSNVVNDQSELQAAFTDDYSTTEAGICAGQSDGTYIPDENSCTRYYICVSGGAVVEYCPWGLYFNPLTGRCGAFSDLPSWTPCLATSPPTFEPSTTPPTTEPASTTEAYDPRCYLYPDGSYLPHPDYCEIYYICISNEALSYTCPGDLVFNPAELRCDFPSTLPSWTPCLTNPNNKCKVEEDGTYLPNPDDCQSYYVCLNGGANRYDCPPGLYYNPVSSLCVLQDNLPPDVPCSYTTRGPTTTPDPTTTYSTETPTESTYSTSPPAPRLTGQ